jgi:hypothetical protein
MPGGCSTDPWWQFWNTVQEVKIARMASGSVRSQAASQRLYRISAASGCSRSPAADVPCGADADVEAGLNSSIKAHDSWKPDLGLSVCLPALSSF